MFAAVHVICSLYNSHVIAKRYNTITDNLCTRWSLSSCELMRMREVINLTIRVTRGREKGSKKETKKKANILMYRYGSDPTCTTAITETAALVQ